MSLVFVKNGSKVFYGSSAKNGCGRGGSRGRGCHMALPYGFAIWPCHMTKKMVEVEAKKILKLVLE